MDGAYRHILSWLAALAPPAALGGLFAAPFTRSAIGYWVGGFAFGLLVLVIRLWLSRGRRRTPPEVALAPAPLVVWAVALVDAIRRG